MDGHTLRAGVVVVSCRGCGGESCGSELGDFGFRSPFAPFASTGGSVEREWLLRTTSPRLWARKAARRRHPATPRWPPSCGRMSASALRPLPPCGLRRRSVPPRRRMVRPRVRAALPPPPRCHAAREPPRHHPQAMMRHKWMCRTSRFRRRWRRRPLLAARLATPPLRLPLVPLRAAHPLGRLAIRLHRRDRPYRPRHCRPCTCGGRRHRPRWRA